MAIIPRHDHIRHRANPPLLSRNLSRLPQAPHPRIEYSLPPVVQRLFHPCPPGPKNASDAVGAGLSLGRAWLNPLSSDQEAREARLFETGGDAAGPPTSGAGPHPPS